MQGPVAMIRSQFLGAAANGSKSFNGASVSAASSASSMSAARRRTALATRAKVPVLSTAKLSCSVRNIDMIVIAVVPCKSLSRSDTTALTAASGAVVTSTLVQLGCEARVPPPHVIWGICAVQVGDSLEEFLVASTSDAKLRQLLMSMSEAIRTIGFKARRP